MTFVQAFYSFIIEVTNADTGTSHKLKVKIPRHPLEPLEYLHARVLAYALSYEEGLEFSRGFFEPRDPALWSHNAIEALTRATYIGELDAETLKHSLRHAPDAKHQVYFYQQEQIDSFCHGMRGSRTNWIESVQFFKFDYELLTGLNNSEQSSSRWDITLVDGVLYLTANGHAFESSVEQLDMWDWYQRHLQQETK